MSGGSRPVRTGSYVGTGAALNIDTPGFTPKRVEFINQDTGATAAWQDTMADDSVNTQDTGIDAHATSGGVTPRETGFALGTNAVVNTDGQTVHWTAIGG